MIASMSRTLEISTVLDCPTETAWHHARTSRLLHYVTHPLIRFRPKHENGFPAFWTEGDYDASMWLFGVLPLGRQTIGIRYPDTSDNTFVLRDDGHGTTASVWDHYIIISERDGGTLYTDRITVDAGWRTPFVAAFASLFYRHRQRRWRKLVRSGFALLEAGERAA